MRRIQPFGVALVMALGVAGVACDDKAATSPEAAPSASAATPAPSASAPKAAPSASAAKAAAADAATDGPSAAALAEDDEHLSMELKAEHRHHHTGFAGFVMMAVDTLGVPADQEADITKIKGDFHKKLKPLREANEAVNALLADGITAGKIDKAKVDAAVARSAAAAADAHAAMDEELNALHAKLKPEQRVALVDKVEAQWTMWKEANAIDQAGENTKPDGRITHFAKDFALTDDQVTKAKAALDAEKDAKKSFEVGPADTHMKAFSTAFVEEKFDAKKLPLVGAENSHVIAWGAERNARFYEALNPILTPDQRTKVAEKLRKHEHGPSAEGKP